MEFGTVVLNYNNFELTKKCVDNLLKIIDDNIVVIVDNNSTNDSFNILKDFYSDFENVYLIKSEMNKGYAAGNNIGLAFLADKFKDLEYYAVMNPDVIVDQKNVFIKLINHLKSNSKIACISPLMILNGEFNLNNCFWSIPSNKEIYRNWLSLDTKKKNNTLKFQNENIGYVDAVPGSFFMFKKSFYEQIDGFDENTFLYNEEIILAISAKKLNYTNAIACDAFYHHNHVKGKRKKLKQKIKGLNIANNSRKYLCKKYYPNYSYFFLCIVSVINIIKLIIKHILGNIYFKIIKR